MPPWLNRARAMRSPLRAHAGTSARMRKRYRWSGVPKRCWAVRSSVRTKGLAKPWLPRLRLPDPKKRTSEAMFKEFGQIANLMQQLPRIKGEMEKLQQRMGQLVAEGDAGAGMVRVRINGRYEVLAVQLTDEALRGNDREMV